MTTTGMLQEDGQENLCLIMLRQAGAATSVSYSGKHNAPPLNPEAKAADGV